ncbi:MAG: prepilin-type N-terminal cleavage/methylation domain-containing protein [Armatimonadetes bacterium]|nr:prepilin-type N-terminal cleavage/methylation domain-containing protein [Armatimonadota bacterium]
MNTKRAFTLIELLVVIAIIAILAAILFPVFAQAKAAAKKTTDLSNTKQQGLGIMMYAGDNDDYFPRSAWTTNVNLWGWQTPMNWRDAVEPYVKGGTVRYQDGSKYRDLAEGGIWSTPSKPTGRGVYAANNNLMPSMCQWDNAASNSRCDQNGDGTPTGNAPFPSVNTSQLDAPAQISATWTIGINPDWNASGDVADSSWWWWGGAQWPPVFTGPTSGEKWDVDGKDWPTWAMPRYRYTSSLNSSFGDGHAKAVKKGQFNWCQYVYVKGLSTNWNDNWDWIFSPGNPCAAFAR